MVELEYGTFKGTKKYSGVNSFLGVPFAKAGRLENARMLGLEDKIQGVQDATNYGPACPQQQLIASPISGDNGDIGGLLSAVEQLILPPIDGQDEDCLNINVQIPEGINSTAGLPVFMWIHGGGYELGASAAVGSETTALPVSAPGLVLQLPRTHQQMNAGPSLSRCQYRHSLNRDEATRGLRVRKLPHERLRYACFAGNHRCRRH